MRPPKPALRNSSPKGIIRPEEEPARVQSFLTAYVRYCLRAVEKVLPAVKKLLHHE